MIHSKHGAAAVSMLLSHEVIGLERADAGGYAYLLGTAMLTGIKVSASLNRSFVDAYPSRCVDVLSLGNHGSDI